MRQQLLMAKQQRILLIKVIKGKAQLIKVNEDNVPLAGAVFVVQQITSAPQSTSKLSSNKNVIAVPKNITTINQNTVAASSSTQQVSSQKSSNLTDNITKQATTSSSSQNISHATSSTSSASASSDINSAVSASATTNSSSLLSKPAGVKTEKAISNANGLVTFDNLQPGTYQVTEIQAPNGYQRTTAKIIMTVNDDNTTVIVNGSHTNKVVDKQLPVVKTTQQINKTQPTSLVPTSPMIINNTNHSIANKKTSLPQTNDDNSYSLIIIVLIVIAVIVNTLII